MALSEQKNREVKTNINFKEPKNFRLSKRAKTIFALSRTPRTHSFANRKSMVDAESFASTVERVVFDKLVPNIAGYGRVIQED
jgi:hypothetical protein